MNGKGSTRRPEDRKAIEANWERVFGAPTWEDAEKAIAARMGRELDAEALRRLGLPHELW